MTDDKKFAPYQSEELRARFVRPRNIALMWDEAARRYADAPCVRCGDERYTYAEMDAQAARFRGVLVQKRLGRGDRVCLMAEKSIAFIKAFLAVQTLGMTAAVLPPLPEESLGGIMRQVGAKLLLCDEENTEKAKHAGIDAVDIAKNGSGSVGTGIGAEKIKESGAETVGAGIVAADMGEDGGGVAAACLTADPEDIAIMIFTGGTTGRPKGALLSHRCVCEGIVNGCYGYEPVFGQRYLLALPLFHVFGLIRSVLTPLYTGSEIIINTSPKQIFADMLTYRPTMAVLVPLLVERGITLSRAQGRNMFGEALKCIITGAAPIAEHLGRECAQMGIVLCPGYGLTETACLVSGNPDILRKPGSVGLLFPNQEVRFVNGELWLRGENLFSGYTDAEETEQAFTDGWFRTGDVARIDEDGFLFIVGRKKEMLLTENGENVYPAEVEARFNALDEVQESQLFVVRDENGHGMLALEVLPRVRGAGDAALMEKLKKINADLPRHCRAKRITLRDSDFERTASMKMKRYVQI